jgi:ATP-dependent helicase/nuclease subunit A
MSTVLNGGPKGLPRELVLASAGTGKTFRISSRIIGLLAAGARAEDVFASTFTRKAAGEILDRVLARLAGAALDEETARELAEHAGFDAGAGALSTEPEFWLGLLRRTVGELHRLNIGTLDSFFVRTAGSFAGEVGLPPGWSIDDTATRDRIRAEALQDVLAHADREMIVELLRGIAGDEARRSVHDAVLDELAGLLDIFHALDGDPAEAWEGLADAVEPPPADLPERRLALAAWLRAVEVPLTKAKTPSKPWLAALDKAAGQLEEGEWEALVASTLCQAARAVGGEYSKHPVPETARAVFAEACALARSVIGTRLLLRGRTLGRLVTLYCEALERRQRDAGLFGFGDLTRALGGPEPLCGREDLHYRLDARIRHVLLDEFQDTSLSQWEVVRPLMDALLAGEGDERATVVVADPKQSIYAWRGGEPLLVRHIGDHYRLKPEELSTSFRSSRVVLELVNRVFDGLPSNPVIVGSEESAAAAADWMAAFAEHRAARELAGHVRMTVGPAYDGAGEDRPRLCRRAAELVAELHREAPERTIGVLTRKNRTVARIMLELRRLDVPASEEGGNPLTDSAAVASVLALLRLADHPGDVVSRYHVARTPLGAVVGLHDHRDGAAARRVADTLRHELLEDGYGQTLARIASQVADACDARERRRMAQLVELGFRYERRATLRVADFVRVVRSERVESPSEAGVRVMTIHQSKGLEFDIVVLPELDASLTRGSPRPLAYRPEPTARITHVFPYVGKDVRPLFDDVEELQEAARQAHAAELRDGLSGLYVALTRARHALHIVVKPDGKNGMGSGCTSANLVRHALGADAVQAVEGTTLFESGDPGWHTRDASAPGTTAGAGPTGTGRTEKVGPIALGPPSGRRSLPRRSPSSLAGGAAVDLRGFLRTDTRAADEGTLAHAWMERIGWIEDGAPDDAELRAVARRVVPTAPPAQVDALLARFRGWLANPVVAEALGRRRHGPGAEVRREVPFAHRDDGALMRGIIDRLVLRIDGGAVCGAEILDFKTDAVSAGDGAALDQRTEHYRPQMVAYRHAVALGYGLPPEAVAVRLLFLEPGKVREV